MALYRKLSSELVRSVRGSRTRAGLSRRLGYRTDVLYAWESGRSAPTALQFLLLLEKCGVDTRAALRSFYVKPPLWLKTLREFPSRAGVAAFLRDQRAQTSVQELAAHCSVSRFALSRWFKGSAEPKLPDFLNVLHHSTHRLTEWVALFVDPSSSSVLASQWKREQAARKAAYELPWTLAVLRTLELHAYQQLARHRRGWIARQLGIEQAIEDQALQLLESSGQITWLGGKWHVAPAATVVNLRHDPKAALAQRVFWSRVAADRAPRDPGMFAYNVCSISERDLERLKRLQREFLQQARLLIAESQPIEQVALIQTQIFALSAKSEPDAE